MNEEDQFLFNLSNNMTGAASPILSARMLVRLQLTALQATHDVLYN
jgi:hypothetical protein